MTTVNANEIALGIESFGDDDGPLVLLAGGTTMLSWPDALCERLAAGLLFGISPTDPVAFGVTALLLAAVALAANLLPARRATTVDPVTALRQE